MIEYRVTRLAGLWQIQASRHIHPAKYPRLDHALAYLTCRLPSRATAGVVITDDAGVTERRVLRREEE